ncbi:MAG: hypothetical protein R3F50_10085 [Gammaproteobacteria bacterium]
MKFSHLRILSVLLLTGLTACATSPQFQASQAALAGDPVAMWQDGQEAVSLGEAQVARGEERVLRGQSIISDGETMVGNGTNLVNVSQDNYLLTVRDLGEAESPEELREEINKLREILNVWEEGEDLISQGNRRIADGNERIEEGRSIVFEGQNLVATGRNMIQSSEQLRRDQEARMMEQENQGLEAPVSPGNPATSVTPPVRTPATGLQPAPDQGQSAPPQG